ncbi:glycosyltransferase family 47 protein [Rhodobacteraceae bacterium]|nr:glycosyltransferase family 47 protein [Paracoccaceae bacterium]
MSDRVTIVPLSSSQASERDWLRYLLEPLDSVWLPREEQPPLIDNALYIYNSAEKLNLPPRFLDAVKALKGCGLLHLGDEYYRGDYSDYHNFQYIIRMYPFTPLKRRGVLTIPLGYTAELGQVDIKPASERKYLSFFAGDWKTDRASFARNFSDLDRGDISLTRSFHGEKGISREDYLQGMADAVFAPSPSGNVGLETSRPYEALEYGAIPIVPSRLLADKFKELLGEHPLPSFNNWRKARRFVNGMASDLVGLDGLQKECLSWWEAEKLQVRDKLVDFLRAGVNGDFVQDLNEQFETSKVGPFNRIYESALQQNLSQIVERSRFIAQRVRHRVGGHGKLEGVWSYRNKK